MNFLISVEPTSAFYFKAIGVVHLKLKQYQEAVTDLSQAIRWDKKMDSVYHCHGLAFDGLKQSWKAIEDYDKALASEPRNADIYVSRGVDYGLVGNNLKALSDFNQAIELNPNHTGAVELRNLMSGASHSY